MITVTSLRKIFTEQGIKGASAWRREHFQTAINTAEEAAYAEDESRKPVVVEIPKGKCNVCGKRKANSNLNGQCDACYEEGSWENEHQDRSHENGETDELCWICNPELNLAQKPVRAGRSRAGMVIIAKGTELHKSMTFKKAAEAAGWMVDLTREFYELAEDATGEGTRYYATATKGEDTISLAWDGRAYDYPASSAQLGGRDRKVRNLKEALRLL